MVVDNLAEAQIYKSSGEEALGDIKKLRFFKVIEVHTKRSLWYNISEGTDCPYMDIWCDSSVRRNRPWVLPTKFTSKICYHHHRVSYFKWGKVIFQ